MTISATEFRKHMSSYLNKAASEDIIVLKHGKPIALLSHPYRSKLDILHSLRGCIPCNQTFDELMAERVSTI